MTQFSLRELVIDEGLSMLNEIRELPCSVCGETGDTMPCITCDKLVCDECGTGTRWCKEHGDNDAI